jgi:hypothetical protein
MPQFLRARAPHGARRELERDAVRDDEGARVLSEEQDAATSRVLSN